MDDIVLSSLINLFAILGNKQNLAPQKSVDLLTSYLSRFYGIRNYHSYVNLYNDLRGYYDDFPSLDKDAVASKILEKLNSRICIDEKVTLLLRLMEFCCNNAQHFDPDEAVFHNVASAFDIDEAAYNPMVAFVTSSESSSVMIHNLDGSSSTLKTLYLDRYNILVVSCDGEDPVWMDDVKMNNNVFQLWQQSSFVKSVEASPIYYSTILQRYNGLKQESVEFCGRNIDFRFDSTSDNGMHNLSFTLHAGELVAIMGGSGVGKSTLLSLLNGNLRPQKGTITINGVPISDPAAKKLIGFVPQDDLLIEELTVYQNLWYTAKLCFEGMDASELDAKVMKVLRELGLDQAGNLKVGSPINKYISGGQRKRLNIALELIREPAILFLDEPTSGLSSTDTEKVVNLLKELTYKGKLIITNIHQPSSDVFKMFDRLWLLDKGGYPVYDGNPIEAVSYFRSAANYADPRSSACPVCGNVNPEIILNIIDSRRFDTSGKITDKRKTTPREWHQMYLDSRGEMGPPKTANLPETGQCRPSCLQQTIIFLRRNISAKVTNLQYMLITILEAPLLAVICALLTRFTPDSGIYTLMDNKNFPSYMFMAIIVSIFMGMSGSAEEIIRDRAILKREKFLSLSYGSYILSKIIFMAAVCLVQTGLFLLVGNAIIGVHGMTFLWWTDLFLSAFLASLTGLLLSQCMNSVVAIYITIPLLLIPQILLCGLVVKFDDLNSRSNTGNVPLIGDVIPSRWAYEGLAVASFSMNDYEKLVFGNDRLRYEAMFYNHMYAYEIESHNERRQSALHKGEAVNPDDLAIIRNAIPVMAQKTGLKPYDGDWSYESVDEYLDRAKKTLSNYSCYITKVLDKELSAYIKEHGQDNLAALKKNSYNLQLENLVINNGVSSYVREVDAHLVPGVGAMYLTPLTGNGRAPFYSGMKLVGANLIPTFWFDMAVLLIMCVLVALCLFFDFPGKYVRKERP